MFDKIRNGVITFLGVVLCLYTIVFVNFNVLQPQSALALFVLIGMVLCYLVYPVHPKFKDNVPLRCVDLLLAATCMFCFGYIFVQVEPIPLFKSFWPGGASLGDRASEESALDIFVGVIGLILVLEATRRSIGWIVPALALAFIAHSYFCWLGMHGMAPQLPDWMLPHQGQSIKEISASTFLQSLGVLGPAAGVMFKYVFLFVVFGAFLEMSGATQFIIDFAEKVFGSSPGGPAKVSVLGSGLMGSLSGSAVANAVTTGSFTIPMMRNSGFAPHIAGGITAAAASGGALVPPVMGAGAYMMLEFVERAPGKPQITFLEIARAALIPAVLYYVSLYLIVHFYSKKVSAGAKKIDIGKRIGKFEGVVFFGALTVLVSLLVASFSPFKAVTGALVLILVLAALRKELAIGASARVIALVVFFASAGIHQFLTPTVMQPALGVFPDWTHSYIAPFLADS